MNGSLARVLSAAFVADLSVHVALGAFSYRARDLGASASDIGLFGGLIDCAYTVVALLLPRYTDARSRARMIRVASLVMAAGATWCSQAASIAGFVAGVAVLRCGTALFWPTLEARVSDGRAHDLGRAVSAFSLSWGLGKALGYALNAFGFGAGLLEPRHCFLVTIAGACVLFLTAPPDVERGAEWAEGGARGVGRARVWAAWIAAFLGCGAFVLLQNQNAPLMAAKGRSPSFGNLLLATVVAVQVLTFLGLRTRAHLVGSNGALKISLGCLVAGFAAVSAIDGAAGMLCGAALLGGGMGLVYTQSLYLSLRLPHRKSVAAGIHEAFVGFANASVAALAGLATGVMKSAGAALLLGMALLIFGGALVLACLRRSRAALEPGGAPQ